LSQTQIIGLLITRQS